MRAEIIASGTELLLGEVADTNTRYIAARLCALGIDLYHASMVGDNFERFTALLRQAWERSDLIITTGGLGPTRGDITREVIAAMLGEEMTIDPTLKEELTAMFVRRGIDMPDNNLKQATLIPSATPLHNSRGTAPGWWVEKDGHTIIMLPGPPAEMQSMWQTQVLPRLKAKSGAVILSRTLKTMGLTEGRVDEMMAPFLSKPNPTLGIYARPDGIHLRITAKASTEGEAEALVGAREKELREIIGKYVWGVDDDTLEGSIGELLREKGMAIAVAESFTCGLLTSALASAPGSESFFRGGMVVPVAAAKSSEESARDMAAQARERYGAKIGIAVDGSCGNEDRAFRTAGHIAIATAEGVVSAPTGPPGAPPQAMRRAANQALVFLLGFLRSR